MSDRALGGHFEAGAAAVRDGVDGEAWGGRDRHRGPGKGLGRVLRSRAGVDIRRVLDALRLGRGGGEGRAHGTGEQSQTGDCTP